MMSTRRCLAVLLVVGAVLLLLATGCGPKPPCAVPPSQVQDAQSKTATAEASLTQTQTERATLEKDLADKQAKLDAMKGKPEELQKQLDNLKKGSGR